MTSPGTLDDLTTQLRDFMDLADSHDLPSVSAARLSWHDGDTQWTAEAQLAQRDDRWELIRAWQVATGGTVTLGPRVEDRWGSPWRKLEVAVSYVGLAVHVWTTVSADDEVPAWAQPDAAEAVSA
jgi:hypothetical protein